jgi:hypothetical protein
MNTKGRNKLAQLGMLAGLVLFTCGTSFAQDVTYNAVQGTDFSKFKTYKWVRIQGAEYPDQIIDQQIKQSIDSRSLRKDSLNLKAIALTFTSATRFPSHRNASGMLTAARVGVWVAAWQRQRLRPFRSGRWVSTSMIKPVSS